MGYVFLATVVMWGAWVAVTFVLVQEANLRSDDLTVVLSVQAVLVTASTVGIWFAERCRRPPRKPCSTSDRCL